MLTTLTPDTGRILSKLHAVQPRGNISFCTGIRVAHVSLWLITWFFVSLEFLKSSNVLEVYLVTNSGVFLFFFAAGTEAQTRQKPQDAHYCFCWQPSGGQWKRCKLRLWFTLECFSWYLCCVSPKMTRDVSLTSKKHEGDLEPSQNLKKYVSIWYSASLKVFPFTLIELHDFQKYILWIWSWWNL